MLNSSNLEQLISSNGDSLLYRTRNGQVRKVLDFRSTMYGVKSPFEVELLHTLHHPYLLTGNGVLFDDEKVSIFLPAADYDLLEGSKYGFSQEELIRFFYQISLALLALHRHKIVHFDVKPENILVFRGPDGKLVAKLGDFGLSRYLTKATKRSPLGTPLYLPPEFSEASIENKYVLLTPSADLWSLGMTFYFLLTDDFYYDLNNGRWMNLNQLHTKNKMLWLSGNSCDNLGRVKNPIIREILSNLLTSAEERWSIEQVVEYLEKIVTPEEHVELIFVEKPLPNDLEVMTTQHCRYLNVDPEPSHLWLRRLLNHLNLESFQLEEVAVVLLYLALMYTGWQKPIKQYLAAIITKITVDDFLLLEKKLFEQLYPTPILDSPKRQEQHKLQRDGEDKVAPPQPQSGTAISVVKSEKKNLVDSTIQEELRLLALDLE